MKSLRLTSLTAMTSLATAAAGAAAQTGANAWRVLPHDSAPAWSLFAPNAKSALPGHEWSVTPPAARLADATREQPNALRCPMPVFVPDTSKQDRMPVAREDSTKVERIPVAKSSCVNSLLKPSRP
jgi:hypothetical protein